MITAIYRDNTIQEFQTTGNIIGTSFRRGNEKPTYFITGKGLGAAEIEYLKRYVEPIRR